MSRRCSVPEQDWAEFCDAYSRRHEGWIASMETAAAEQGDVLKPADPDDWATVASDSVLCGVTLEDHQPRRELLVSLATEDGVLNHRIRPLRIDALQTDTRLDEGLLVSDVAGRLTRIRFRVPANPDVLDGLARH